MKAFFVNSLKGFGMGAANVIPGVSGGTIALLTGIYHEIIAALDSLMRKETWAALFKGQWKAFWQAVHGPFLLSLGIGILVSVLSLARLMTYVLAYYPVRTWAFFFGLILSSAFVMFRDIRGWGWKEVLFVLLGAAFGVWVSTLESLSGTPDDLWFIFLCGVLAICTMILPGVSGSFILVILDKYDYIMKALDVTAFNWPVIIAFGLGCGVGILAFAKFLHWLLGKWEKQTMLVLLGFILGSLVKVWPWSNPEALSRAGIDTGACLPGWEGALLWCLIGIAFVGLLEGLSRRGGQDKNNENIKKSLS